MKNLVGLWVKLSRAYEIALLGKFSIRITFDPEYKEGFDDYKSIKEFYKDVNFNRNGDLIVEIHKPDYSGRGGGESLKHIIARVHTAEKNARPIIFNNDSCDLLLKNATSKLNFSLSEEGKVIEIASVIAQLDKSASIRVEHLAEAIQYKVYNDEACINPDIDTISFGDGIEISLFELYGLDIDNAIKYLNSRRQYLNHNT